MTVFKPMVLALAGASVIALSTITLSTPADAQWRGRTAAAAGIGFAAGAVLGAAVASPRYYGSPYGYYGSPYSSYGYYEPAPTYYESYESAPVYVAPSYGYSPYGYYYQNPSRPRTSLSQTEDPNRP